MTETTQNPPRLFDDDANLLPVDVSKLSPEMAARYDAVRTAYDALQDAKAFLETELAELPAAVNGVRNVEGYIAAHWRPMTYHDLWLASFTGEDYAHSGRR